MGSLGILRAALLGPSTAEPGVVITPLQAGTVSDGVGSHAGFPAQSSLCCE